MLKLHAGVPKKVGLPGFSNASASCTIEAEPDGSLLHDRDGFQTVVQRANQSCEQAFNDQIARLLAQGNEAPASLDATADVSEQPQPTNGPQTRSQGPSRASQPVKQPVPQQVAEQATQPDVIEVRTSPAVRRAPSRASSRPSSRASRAPVPPPSRR